MKFYFFQFDVDHSTLVNSDSEQDSGLCEASDLCSADIDSVMVPLFRRPVEEKAYRHLNLDRCNSDVTHLNVVGSPSKHRSTLTRALSNVETSQTSLETSQTAAMGTRSPIGSPKLAHMKMTSTRNNINLGAVLPNVDFLARKSDLSVGYRYYNGELIDVNEGTKRVSTNTGRKYLFQGLLGERSSLWDNMDFWEYLFHDVVAAERDALGMNQNHGEMIER